jgi:hypothetical protein
MSRFRGELSTVPPVQIAVRRTGLETTINWNVCGADRALSGNGLRSIGDPRRSGPLPTDRYLIPGTRIDFGGGSIAAMTSSGLGQFKELLLATQAREREIRSDLRKARLQHAVSWSVRALAWSSLVSLVSKSVRAKVTQAVALRKGELSTLRDNLAASRISISFDMETAVAEPHVRMLDSFDRLAMSQGSWALTMSQQIDRVRARSMSNGVVDRRPARLTRRSDPLVDTADCPLSLPVQNGASTAYFYPGFMLVVNAARSDFAVIDLKELEVSFTDVRFTESGGTPGDAQQVGKVWAKSNKNGTRDRRFKDNRELPVMLYGELNLKAPGGLLETFMFSRYADCQAFVRAIQDLKRILTSQSPVRLSPKPKALR